MLLQNSIQQFRAERQRRNKDSSGTAAKSKQRLALGAREAEEFGQDLRASSRQGAQAVNAEYNPGEGVESWYGEIEALREERRARADSERSTTDAMDVNPLARTRPADNPNRWDGPTGMTGGAGGRAGAEEYLGRSMSDEEWEMLARTTYAEATSDPAEQAAVMSVILNRAKADGYPDDIVAVVNQPNQFQAVTGTRGNRQPSSRFKSFNDDVLTQFEENVTPRLGNFAGNNWLNFTAANPAAYGEGTNIGFMDDVNNSDGSALIGGTLFGTVRG